MSRKKNSGLFYGRRSTEKQEASLPTQLNWALKQAEKQGVRLDASLDDLGAMIDQGLSANKGMRIDNGISGLDLSRPGLLALNKDAIADKAISHVFIHKRDRYARPDEALKAVEMEKSLLYAGITVVFSDAISLPLRRGESNWVKDFELLLAYVQNGEELRKLAERIVLAQLAISAAGFRTGGNPPYGYGRALVDGSGKVIQKLVPGTVIKREGCHVAWIPQDKQKISIWLQILDWRQMGYGYKRIATMLNEMGIPSPGAGRIRTDHGEKHLVSGLWTDGSVRNLCANGTIAGFIEYGKRSEGKIRRISPDGPRLLDEELDFNELGKLRTIKNDRSTWVIKQAGTPRYSVEAWQAIQKMGDERSKNQRGIPRHKDPKRYPLSCRLIDLTNGCGSLLYGRTFSKQTVYLCGRYMQHGNCGCCRNFVDAEAMLQFVLKTLKQIIDQNGSREKLQQQLLARANRDNDVRARDASTTELKRLGAQRSMLLKDQERIEYRMSRETDDELYTALSGQYRGLKSEIGKLEEAIQQLEKRKQRERSQAPSGRVAAALEILDEISRICGDNNARKEVGQLLHRLGMKIGLTFSSITKGKRTQQVLSSGRIAFGNSPLPVPLYGKSNLNGGQTQQRSDEVSNKNSKQKESTANRKNLNSEDGDISSDDAQNESEVVSDSINQASGIPLAKNHQVCREGTSDTKDNRGTRRSVPNSAKTLLPFSTARGIRARPHKIKRCPRLVKERARQESVCARQKRVCADQISHFPR
jgi:hypothetical protein